MLEVRVLGPLEVAVGGTPVALRSPSQRRIVAALLAGGGFAGRSRLIDAVWPTGPPPSADRTLQSQVSRLRALLGPDRLVTRPPGWELRADLVDAAEMERLVIEARAARGVDAVAAYERALAWWRGEPYGDLSGDPVVQAEARRIAELRLAARLELGDALVGAGDPGVAVALLEAVVVEDPVHEQAWACLVRALAAAGRTAAALRAAQRARAELRAVGLDPMGPLREAEQEVAGAGDRTSRARTEIDGRPSATPTSLPPLRTELVGRGRELADIAELLRGGRCVSLVGPGGVGKTRLAIEAAGASGQPTAFCDLAAVQRPAAVLPALAEAVGAAMTPPLEERIAARCRASSCLVVIDNCEHVIDEAARVVTAVLDSVPELAVVATSREPLRIEGEHVVVLDPLSPSEAAHLFELRSAAAGRTADAGSDIEELCRRLDHLPLAIEMAAGWARSLTAGEMLIRLDDRSTLRSPRRSVAARHRSLDAAVRWSYDLLTEPERVAFEWFAVVAGALDLEAAAEVVGQGRPPDATRALMGLVDRSLLTIARSSAGSRVRMLETTRAVAREALRRRGVEAEAVAAHAAWAARWSGEASIGLRGPDSAAWSQRLTTALPDLRAAVERGIDGGPLHSALEVIAALAPFVYLRLRTDVAAWAADAVAAGRAAGIEVPPDAIACAAMGPLQAGDMLTADEALAGVEGAVAALLRSDSALFTGDLGRAVGEGQTCRELARIDGDPFLEALGLWNMALGRGYAGDVDAALGAVAGLRRLAASSGCPLVDGWADFTEGEFLVERDPARAVLLLERAAARSRACGAEVVEGIALVTLTTVRARHGDPREAIPQLEATIRLWERHGNWTHQAVTLRNLVVLLERLGHDASAVMLLGAVEAHRPAFGAHATRLAPVRSRLLGRLGPRGAELERAGMVLEPPEVVAAALDALERAKVPPGGVTAGGTRGTVR